MKKNIEKSAKWLIGVAGMVTAYKIVAHVARREANVIFDARIEVERHTTDTRTAAFIAAVYEPEGGKNA